MRVAQVDVTRVGGITEYLEITTAMNTAGIRVIPPCRRHDGRPSAPRGGILQPGQGDRVLAVDPAGFRRTRSLGRHAGRPSRDTGRVDANCPGGPQVGDPGTRRLGGMNRPQPNHQAAIRMTEIGHQRHEPGAIFHLRPGSMGACGDGQQRARLPDCRHRGSLVTVWSRIDIQRGFRTRCLLREAGLVAPSSKQGARATRPSETPN